MIQNPLLFSLHHHFVIQTLTWINMPQRTVIVYSRSFLQVVVYDKPPMDVCPEIKVLTT